jgi:hypothetical protein
MSDPGTGVEETLAPGNPANPWLVGGVLLAGVAVVVGLVVWRGGDEEIVPADSTTTMAATTSTTTAEVTTTSAAVTTTVAVDVDDISTAVWPWFESSQRFDNPVAVARSFAVDYLGFTDVVLGEFQQGDGRSGEVEIRAREAGPVTTVFVRQLGINDAWWVIGSATPNIEIDSPAALSTIGSSVRLEGRASAFEGTVDVAVRADGESALVGEGFVTGNGDGTLGAFSSDLEFTNPGSGWGSVVFTTASAEDGSIMEAAVVRVRFAATG